MSKREQGLSHKQGQCDPVESANRLDALAAAMARTRMAAAGPLAELSALLGVEVVDVLRGFSARYPAGPGYEQPKVWWLVRAPNIRGAAFTSDDLRRAGRLNETATYWGRSLDAPRLTAQDGRSVIRLLHEVMEAKVSTA